VITLVFLIGFPLIAAMLLLFIRGARLRSWIVVAASMIIMLGSLSLVVTHFPLPSVGFAVSQEILSIVLLALEIGLCAFILVVSIRKGRLLAGLLAVVQMGIMVATELLFGRTVQSKTQLAADKLSVIMALIVGIIGGLITIYALSYMKAYHAHHPEIRDRRRLFFFLQFLFLSAMFGLFFSNNLVLLHFFWEITTLCSFLLIGYNGDAESGNKAFLALNINLLGGAAFAAAIMFISGRMGIIELDSLVRLSKVWGLVPAVLLAFAGMTKSAQMPFSSWLLGAMVAPTPVSALLHSSTMVKAGVYLLLRMAPVVQGTLPGVMIALIGGVTFLLTSLIAVSQRDAKRVLAYSTVGNLALVVLCAGVGTYESVWAGILLILFHAVTKCLLFLCVGSYEQKTGTRDIESMSGLIISMPRLSIMVQIGIAGMFLAPFGMLVSKWAVLKALTDFNPLLAVFVVFGSSATLFFWVKWMGKLLEVTGDHENIESGIGARQWISLLILSGLTVALVGFYPAVSSLLIEPYVVQTYGMPATIGQGNIVIMTIMLAMVALFPTTFFVYGRRVKVVDAYLGGANADSSVRFRGAAGEVKSMAMSNYYLSRAFGEGRLLTVGVIACTALLLVMFGVAPL
jgi:ech hydrogenase subunit A